MKKILVSGLINIETTLKVKEFPISYSPIEYEFFGIHSGVAGVAYNVALALKTLEDAVTFVSMVGQDMEGTNILQELQNQKITTTFLQNSLKETPTSLILYDETGRRKIYCDLKDIQEAAYPMEHLEKAVEESDIIVACNCNFNRPLLKLAREKGKLIATDVHVLSDIEDAYNKDFMEYADILFLSDEALPIKADNPLLVQQNIADFLKKIAAKYGCSVIVLGQGSQGAMMYLTQEQRLIQLPVVENKQVVNTVGAGDALFSSFIHYYAKGFAPEECLKRAECFASHKIGFNGAATGFIAETEVEALYEKFWKHN